MTRAAWDERFAEPELAYGTEPNDFLAEVTDRLPHGRALFLAEGQGRNAVHLARLGWDVTAMDQSEVGLARARDFGSDYEVAIETVTADLAEFEIEPRVWDVIVSIWAHVPPVVRTRVHAACVAGLRGGGAFVLEAYTPAQIGRGTGGPSVSELTMTADGLRRELAGLDFEILRELERDVYEGTCHTGPSSVVQVLARRT